MRGPADVPTRGEGQLSPERLRPGQWQVGQLVSKTDPGAVVTVYFDPEVVFFVVRWPCSWPGVGLRFRLVAAPDSDAAVSADSLPRLAAASACRRIGLPLPRYRRTHYLGLPPHRYRRTHYLGLPQHRVSSPVMTYSGCGPGNGAGHSIHCH